MTGRSRVALGGFGLMAALMAGAAFAWACTANATISLSPDRGPVGTEVTVTGAQFQPGAPVEIRWGSETGEVVAQTSVDAKGDFRTSFAVPEYPEDEAYTVVALSRYTTPSGVEMTARAPKQFIVTGPADPATTSVTTSSAATTPAGGGATSATVAGGRGGTQAAVETTGTRGDVFAVSDAAAGGTGSTPAVVATGSDRRSPEPARGTAASATSDLVSGFASASPSLLPGLTSEPAASGSGAPGLVPGIVLLATGLLALGGGVIAAEIRRRRAPADGKGVDA